MSYSTNTTILSLFPSLPQTNTSNKYSSTVDLIDRHITRSDNFINGKLAKRYDISSWDTSTNVPPMIKTISEDLASFYTWRTLFSNDNQNYSEWIEHFNYVFDELEKIKDGEIDLVDPDGNLIEERTTSNINLVDGNNIDYAPFFAEDEVTSWKVDTDKLDDISDDRS